MCRCSPAECRQRSCARRRNRAGPRGRRGGTGQIPAAGGAGTGPGAPNPCLGWLSHGGGGGSPSGALAVRWPPRCTDWQRVLASTHLGRERLSSAHLGSAFCAGRFGRRIVVRPCPGPQPAPRPSPPQRRPVPSRAALSSSALPAPGTRRKGWRRKLAPTVIRWRQNHTGGVTTGVGQRCSPPGCLGGGARFRRGAEACRWAFPRRQPCRAGRCGGQPRTGPCRRTG